MTRWLLLLLVACTPEKEPVDVGPALEDTAGDPIDEDGNPNADDEGSDTAPPPVETDGLVELAVPEKGYQLHIGPFELPAFTEAYHCKILKAPNTEVAEIIGLAHQASSSVHHFNVWALVAPPDEEMAGDCDDLWAETNMALSSPLYASQTPSFEGWFPDGVAARMPADQWLLMEYHAINPTAEDLWTEGYINAYTAEPGTIDTYANGLYGSNTDLEIPAGESRSFSSRCTVDVEMNVFVMGSHFHEHGTLFEVHRIDAEGNRGDLIYTNDDWESPELVFWTDEPLVVHPGEGFEYTCHYQNDTDQTVSYGPSATDEMCMMVAVYYPDAGFKICLETSG